MRYGRLICSLHFSIGPDCVTQPSCRLQPSCHISISFRLCRWCIRVDNGHSVGIQFPSFLWLNSKWPKIHISGQLYPDQPFGCFFLHSIAIRWIFPIFGRNKCMWWAKFDGSNFKDDHSWTISNRNQSTCVQWIHSACSINWFVLDGC